MNTGTTAGSRARRTPGRAPRKDGNLRRRLSAVTGFLLEADADQLVRVLDALGDDGRGRLREALAAYSEPEKQDARSAKPDRFVAAKSLIDTATYQDGYAVLSSRTQAGVLNYEVHWETAERVAGMMPRTYEIYQSGGSRRIRNVKIGADRG